MNLATLVSSLVLAASTATAGLLVAPSSPLHATPQDGDSGFQVGPLCLGACGNETGNQTSPDGNETAPPPPSEPSSPPADGNQTAPPDDADTATCGVDIDDSREVE